jgi:hypothetical protein
MKLNCALIPRKTTSSDRAQPSRDCRFRTPVHAALLATAALLSATCVPSPAWAAPTPQTLSAECTTDATGGDGVRHDCDSQPSTLTAPAGFVFIQNGLTGGETSGNGDEHECRNGWSNFVEVLPGSGITQPRTFSLRAHARSPSGHWSGRGWSVCTYTLTLTQYQPN